MFSSLFQKFKFRFILVSRLALPGLLQVNGPEKKTKKFFGVREKSGNLILSRGKLRS